jgi:hypothetical protein
MVRSRLRYAKPAESAGQPGLRERPVRAAGSLRGFLHYADFRIRHRVLAWLGRVGRDPERELNEFKQEFDRASREKDRDALDRLVHPDFSMVTPDGDTVSKRGVIAGIVAPGSDFMPHFHRQERTTTFSAGRNLVREVANVSMGGHIPGRGELTGEYTHSAIFILSERGWQFFGNTLTRKNSKERRGPARSTDGTRIAAVPEP